jgi:molecular chaperone GrpE
VLIAETAVIGKDVRITQTGNSIVSVARRAQSPRVKRKKERSVLKMEEENKEVSEVETPCVGEGCEKEAIMCEEAESSETTEKVVACKEKAKGNEKDVLEEEKAPINNVVLRLDSIKQLTENIAFQLEHNKRKEELIDKLHAENQGYKNGMYQKLVMPFVNENIFLIDNYTKLCKGYEGKDTSEIDVNKLLRQLGDIVEDLENTLYKNGIEAYESEVGAEVDFAKQKIVKTVLTNEQEKDKTVCESLKKGFVLDEKIIRQEQISCYKYEVNNTNPTEKE